MTSIRGLPPSEVNWHYEYITPDLLQAERLNKIVYTGETPYQSVIIQDTACFGRSLVLDEKTQSTTLDEFIYHEALVLPTLISHPNPNNVFVAGGGEGATIREVLSHQSVQQVVMVDIDQEVVDLCQYYMPGFSQGAFEDPRLVLHHTDALGFLEQSTDLFDLAIIDVPDPLEGGPAYLLYTQEFYKLLRQHLNTDGVIVAQSGPTGPAFYKQCFSAVANTIKTAFPKVSTYEAFVPSFGSTWGFTWGSLRPDPEELSIEEIDMRIATRLINEPGFYDGLTHQGMFSVPKYLRKALSEETRVITKAEPLFVK